MSLQDSILDKAEKMFLRFGIKSISMDDLAQALGVSKKTIYQYFPKKHDLVHQVVLCNIKRDKAAMEAIHENSENAIEEIILNAQHILLELRQLSDATVYDMKKYFKGIWQLIEQHHRDHIYEVVGRNLQWGIETGLYRPDINVSIVSRLYATMAISLMDATIFPGKEMPRPTVFLEMMRYNIHGICTKKGLDELEAKQWLQKLDNE